MDRRLRIHQVLGLPAPPGYALVIPKYEPCPQGAWSLAGVKYCRVIGHYDAVEIRRAAERVGLKAFADPLYEARIPILGRHDIMVSCDPTDSLKSIVSSPSSPLEELVVNIASMLEENGVPLDKLGVTGTLGLGMELEGISDIDLVVYGARSAASMVDAFQRIGGVSVRGKAEWVNLRPKWDLGWRRRVVGGVQVSWIGAPDSVGEHCKPLRDWRRMSPPRRVDALLLTIPPGQVEALLYPPCVKSEEGFYVVSYEYNAALHLYKGGKMRVRGLSSGDTVYLGTLEEPGSIEIL